MSFQYFCCHFASSTGVVNCRKADHCYLKLKLSQEKKQSQMSCRSTVNFSCSMMWVDVLLYVYVVGTSTQGNCVMDITVLWPMITPQLHWWYILQFHISSNIDLLRILAKMSHATLVNAIAIDVGIMDFTVLTPVQLVVFMRMTWIYPRRGK